MRPVRTVSLFDSKDMLKDRIAKGERVSIESQWGIKAFNIFDHAFELTEHQRAGRWRLLVAAAVRRSRSRAAAAAAPQPQLPDCM